MNKLLDTADMENAIHAQEAEPKTMTLEKFAMLLQTDCSSMREIVKQAGVKIE